MHEPILLEFIFLIRPLSAVSKCHKLITEHINILKHYLRHYLR